MLSNLAAIAREIADSGATTRDGVAAIYAVLALVEQVQRCAEALERLATPVSYTVIHGVAGMSRSNPDTENP